MSNCATNSDGSLNCCLTPTGGIPSVRSKCTFNNPCDTGLSPMACASSRDACVARAQLGQSCLDRAMGCANICAVGMACDSSDNTCKRISSVPVPPCLPGQTRDEWGNCQYPPCPSGQNRDANGVCQVPPCPSGQTRENGVCVSPPVVQPPAQPSISCPSGQILVNGACESITRPQSTLVGIATRTLGGISIQTTTNSPSGLLNPNTVSGTNGSGNTGASNSISTSNSLGLVPILGICAGAIFLVAIASYVLYTKFRPVDAKLQPKNIGNTSKIEPTVVVVEGNSSRLESKSSTTVMPVNHEQEFAHYFDPESDVDALYEVPQVHPLPSSFQGNMEAPTPNTALFLQSGVMAPKGQKLPGRPAVDQYFDPAKDVDCLFGVPEVLPVPQEYLAGVEKPLPQTALFLPSGVMAQGAPVEQSSSVYASKLGNNAKQASAGEPQIQNSAPRVDSSVERESQVRSTVQTDSVSNSGEYPLMVMAMNEIDHSQIEFGEPIGHGSYGKVFRAKWNGQVVAVKESLEEILAADAEDQLMRELSVWFPLKHPNIVPLYGANVRGPKPFLVMPLYNNGCAYRYLAKNPRISMQDRLFLVLGVAAGMEYLHKCNVIHGDLKSDNVMIDDNRVAVIADFGLSFIKKSASHSSLKKITGAIRFLAPELFKRGQSNPGKKSDVFAFAMTAYQLLTGLLPFEEERRDEIVREWIKEGERPDRQEGLSDQVWELLERCWDKDPEKRPLFEEITVILRACVAA